MYFITVLTSGVGAVSDEARLGTTYKTNGAGSLYLIAGIGEAWTTGDGATPDTGGARTAPLVLALRTSLMLALGPEPAL